MQLLSTVLVSLAALVMIPLLFVEFVSIPGWQRQRGVVLEGLETQEEGGDEEEQDDNTEEDEETEEDGQTDAVAGMVDAKAGVVGGRSPHTTREGLKLGKAKSKLDPAKEMKKLFKPLEKVVNKMGDKMKKLDDKLENIPKLLQKQIKETEKKTASGLNSVAKKITRVVDQVVSKLERFVQFVVDIALAIGSYMRCGVEKIVRLPSCWYFYALEMFGKLLYSPFSFLFWVLGQRSLERQLWDVLEEVDATVYEATRGIWGTGGSGGAAMAGASVPNMAALMLFRALGVEWDYGCPENPFSANARYRPLPPEDAKKGAAQRRRAEGEGLHIIHFPDWVVDDCYRCGGGGGGDGGKKGLRSFPNPKDYF